MPDPAHTRVLLVEDDADIVDLVASLLTDEGMSVAVAHNGQMALGCLEGFDPDVIVTDLMMPVMDGFAFMKAYAERPGRHVPILVTSAFSGYLQELHRIGRPHFLQKPFDPDELVTRVRGLASGQPGKSGPVRETPGDELSRLQAVATAEQHEPAMHGSMDRFAKRVAAIFEVPICLVSIVTEHQERWSSQCGLPEEVAKTGGMERVHSYCTHSVAAQQPLIVQDAAENPLFAHNPFQRRVGFRFYAGAPLITRQGQDIGTLCLLDKRPRVFRHFDLELLRVLSKRVLAELEWQEHLADGEVPGSSFRYLQYLDEETGVLGRPAFEEVLRAMAARSSQRARTLALAGIRGEAPALAPWVRAIEDALPTALLGRINRSLVSVLVEMEPAELQARLRELAPGAKAISVTPVGTFPGAAPDALHQIEWRSESHPAA